MQAERVEVETGDGANVANAGVTLPSSSGGEVHFLDESKLADKCLCLGNGISPVAGGVLCPAIYESATVFQM